MTYNFLSLPNRFKPKKVQGGYSHTCFNNKDVRPVFSSLVSGRLICHTVVEQKFSAVSLY